MFQATRRNFSFLFFALATTAMTFVQVGCDSDQLAELIESEQGTQSQYNNQPLAQNPNANAGAANNNDPAAKQIIVGSFNIQSFGKTKMGKPAVVGALVDIARRFDILAIQELRDKDQSVIPDFLSHINQNGFSYAAAVGPRQGYIVAALRRTYSRSLSIC